MLGSLCLCGCWAWFALELLLADDQNFKPLIPKPSNPDDSLEFVDLLDSVLFILSI